MNYIRQLDSIRAIAVLLVIITHWFPEGHHLNTYTSIFNGVDIFFALSGFLITGILLKNRDEVEQRGTNKISIIKSFFFRRFLRIFPIYYLVLFVFYLLGPATGTTIRSGFLYYVTYTSNIYFLKIQSWDGILSHLWSLSVEEQFYVIWPWLMLFTGRKYLLPSILASVLIGIAGQFLLWQVPYGGLLPFCCFDGFGIGALLAWVVVCKPPLLQKYYSILTVVAIMACSIPVINIATHSAIIVLPSRTITSICTIWAIAGIILHGQKQSLFYNRFLKNRFLVFMGKISYGIYLYHLLIPHFSNSVFNRINAHLPAVIYRHNFYLTIFENFCLVLLLSYLSWRIIEQPILRLKKYFEYQKPVTGEYHQIVAR